MKLATEAGKARLPADASRESSTASASGPVTGIVGT